MCTGWLTWCVCVYRLVEVVCAYRLVEVVSHGVGQRPDGIIEDQQVLVLVLAKGEHQGVQDEAQVGDQLCACLLLQSSKRTGEGKGERSGVRVTLARLSYQNQNHR